MVTLLEVRIFSKMIHDLGMRRILHTTNRDFWVSSAKMRVGLRVNSEMLKGPG